MTCAETLAMTALGLASVGFLYFLLAIGDSVTRAHRGYGWLMAACAVAVTAVLHGVTV